MLANSRHLHLCITLQHSFPPTIFAAIGPGIKQGDHQKNECQGEGDYKDAGEYCHPDPHHCRRLQLVMIAIWALFFIFHISSIFFLNPQLLHRDPRMKGETSMRIMPIETLKGASKRRNGSRIIPTIEMAASIIDIGTAMNIRNPATNIITLLLCILN